MTEQPDVAGAVLALDQAMIALAVAKSTLLGEGLNLAAAEARPPGQHFYRGSAGYGTPCITCWQAPGAHDMDAHHDPAPTGHLPQHTHGEPGCTYCGKDHAAVTR